MSDELSRFRERRERLNRLVLKRGSLNTRRFFGLDSAVYRDGALPARTKELLGLVASTVLRCNDCIAYHVGRCAELGISSSEFVEALDVALVVGGSIVIPHLRYAYALWQEAVETRKEAGSDHAQ
jgi:AhpD family alkylhydroperoxidase